VPRARQDEFGLDLRELGRPDRGPGQVCAERRGASGLLDRPTEPVVSRWVYYPVFFYVLDLPAVVHTARHD